MAAPVTLVTELGIPYGAANPFANGGAAPVKATSGNVANASAVATLAADATKFTYITGFDVTGSGATVGLPAVVTIAGLAGGSITYTYTAAVGALVPNTPLSIRFPNPMPSSAINTAITVTCAALGAGNTNNVVNAFGFVA